MIDYTSIIISIFSGNKNLMNNLIMGNVYLKYDRLKEDP